MSTVTYTIGSGTGSSLPSSLPPDPYYPPNPPTNVSAVAGNAEATVYWTAPTYNGNLTIEDYTITSSPGNFTNTVAFPATSGTVTGLTNGTSYTFTVTARNPRGSSSPSSASSPVTPVTPLTVPSQPTSVTAVAGNQQATVSWTAPANNGGTVIRDYTITSVPSVSIPLVNYPNTSVTITGLTNGTSYTFTVTARNDIGSSSPSSASPAVTPATIPNPPTNVTAIAGNQQATVSWTAPTNNGGSAIIHYAAFSSPGNIASSVYKGSYNNQTGYYRNDVVWNNDPSQVTSSTYGYSGTADNKTYIFISSNIITGLAPNAAYAIGWWAEYLPTTSGTVTGLTNGTSYTFTVYATNAIGSSTYSVASPAVTPATIPNPPTNVTAIAGNQQATVSWTAPTNNGGSAIIHYAAFSSPGNIASSIYRGSYNNQTVYALNDVVWNNDPSQVTGISGYSGIADNKTYIFISSTTISGLAPNAAFAIGWWAEYLPTTSGTVTGLTNGTSYTFTVKATNVMGSSLSSVPSSAVIPRTVPGPPTSVSAVAGNAQATVSWTAPTNNGGATIEDYTITSSPGNFINTVAFPATSGTVTGLTNGTSYTFTVTARNPAGSSISSSPPSSAVIPRTVPGPPTDVSAVAGNAEATVYWTAPTNNGGATISSYTITSSPGNFSNTVTGTERTGTVIGLTNGTSYTFTVYATNSAGNSILSSPSNFVTPSAPPGKPTSVSAVAGNKQATVSWTAPTNNGGSVIDTYTITSSPDGKEVFSSSSPAIVAGLTNGIAYTFTVVAINSGGSSIPSDASSSVTPGTVPTPPRNVSAIVNNGEALVSWNAPTDNGGYAINTYTVSYSPGGTPVTISASLTSYTFTGLAVGTSYTYTVTANNFIGSSSPSSTSNYVYFTLPITLQIIATAAGVSNSMSALRGKTLYDSAGNTSIIPISGPYSLRDYFLNKSFIAPYTVPDPPTSVTAVAGNQQATVSWTAPANNGGTVIRDYTITSVPSVSIPLVNYPNTSVTITGLTNGTSYTFTVTARNDIGSSSPSSASSSVTPIYPNPLTSTQFIWVAPNGTGIPNFYAWDVAIPTANGTYSCMAVDSGNSSRFFRWTTSISGGRISASRVIFTGFISHAAIQLYSSPSYAYQYGSPSSLSVFPTSISGYFCLDFLHQNPTDAIYILTVTRTS